MNITIAIAGVTVITSLLAFNNHTLLEELIFWPYRVWRNNEWHRLITSGFIHGSPMHLIVNMISFYSFGVIVEEKFSDVFHGMGLTLYVIMYFVAVVGSDMYDLFTRKDDYSYRSLGASGGVSAILFACILLYPFSTIGLYFFIPVPALIFGPLYIAYSIYMGRRGGDNINHNAHFIGAVIGFIFPIIFAPELLPRFIGQITNHLSTFKL